VIRLRIAGGILAAAASELSHTNRRPDGRECNSASQRISLFMKTARQVLLRAVALLASWAIGLVVAAWIVPGVTLSVPGFIVAVMVFAVTQAILSLSILKLPHWYVPLLLGGTGLALTIVALILASMLARGLTIDGMASWLATTVVVWLVTTIGAVTLPELLIPDGAGTN
jgi:Mycobacterial 4 TMS phage holin, superfamily IV